MKPGQNSVEVRPIGGVDREEHPAKLVIEGVFEVRGVSEQAVGRIPLLVQEQLIELLDASREFRELGCAELIGSGARMLWS